MVDLEDTNQAVQQRSLAKVFKIHALGTLSRQNSKGADQSAVVAGIGNKQDLVAPMVDFLRLLVSITLKCLMI